MIILKDGCNGVILKMQNIDDEWIHFLKIWIGAWMDNNKDGGINECM